MKRFNNHHNRVIFGFFAILLLLSGFSVLAVRSAAPLVDLTAQFTLLPKDCKTASDASNIAKCNFTAFLELIKNVIETIMKLVFIIAPLLIVYGGIVILTSGGSTERISNGKKIITGAIIGIVIALSSFLIIRTIYFFTKESGVVSPPGSHQFNP